MRAIFMAFSWTPRRWRGGRVRGRRRRPTVLRVDRPPHLEQRLALAPHACHVTRDVETDRSRCGVAREGQRAVRVERLDVAVAVALVAEAVAAAEARDVLQLGAVLDGVPVQPLDLSGPRELGKLPPGQRLDLVADLVSGHRRGCSASCRPGLPRGDRGRASPVQECPALHRWSSSSSGGLTIALPLNLWRVASARRVSRRPVSSMITLDDGTGPPGPSQPGFLSPAGRRCPRAATV